MRTLLEIFQDTKETLCRYDYYIHTQKRILHLTNSEIKIPHLMGMQYLGKPNQFVGDFGAYAIKADMRCLSAFGFTFTKAPASVQSGTPFSACVRSRRTGAVPLQAAPVGTAPFPKPEIDISILLLLSYKPFSLPPI